MPKKQVTVKDLDASIAAWSTRLKRAFNKVDDLQKQRKRLILKMAEAALLTPVHVDRPPPRPRGHVALNDMVGTFGPAIRESLEDKRKAEATKASDVSDISWSEMTGADLREAPQGLATVGPRVISPVPDVDLDTLPGFLQRKKLDPVAQQIADEQADLKKRKANIRIANLKAKKSGETKRMPLSGKAALDKIKNG